jgi:hypothetical protein
VILAGDGGGGTGRPDFVDKSREDAEASGGCVNTTVGVVSVTDTEGRIDTETDRELRNSWGESAAMTATARAMVEVGL